MEQMMNYSEMTDFEINKAVGEIVLEGKWACKPGYSGNNSTSWYYGSVDTFINPYPLLPDYCNSWADAGPIIDKHKIDLVWYEIDACWGAHKGMPCAYEKSPLRAAMIIFLKTQELSDA